MTSKRALHMIRCILKDISLQDMTTAEAEIWQIVGHSAEYDHKKCDKNSKKILDDKDDE